MRALRMIKAELSTKAGRIFNAAAIVAVILPLVVRDQFFINAMMLVYMYSIIALAWNLMNGYTGLLSFGHAVFFGIGAYTLMLLLYRGVTPWIGMLLGGLLSAGFAFLLGVPFSRLRSHWFALGTLVLGEIFLIVFANWRAVGGALGLDQPRRLLLSPPSIYWLNYARPTPYYYLALGILGLELLLLYAILNSRPGYFFQAIREDEEAAMASGINVTLYKCISMAISGFFTGVAGGIYTVRFGYIDPYAVFSMMRISVYPVIAGLIGGVYSLIGPIIGSLIFVPTAEYLRAIVGGTLGSRFQGVHFASFGIVLLIISMRIPEGLMGWLEMRGLLKPLMSSGGGSDER